MLYRFLRAFNEYYGFIILGLYIVAFCATFLLFLYPPLAIVLVLASIYALIPFWAFGKLMKMFERRVARRAIQAGCCPACDADVEALQVEGELVHECTECDLVLTAAGNTWEGEAPAAGDEPSARMLT